MTLKWVSMEFCHGRRRSISACRMPSAAEMSRACFALKTRPPSLTKVSGAPCASTAARSTIRYAVRSCRGEIAVASSARLKLSRTEIT
jgi:hypothetical protein